MRWEWWHFEDLVPLISYYYFLLITITQSKLNLITQVQWNKNFNSYKSHATNFFYLSACLITTTIICNFFYAKTHQLSHKLTLTTCIQTIWQHHVKLRFDVLCLSQHKTKTFNKRFLITLVVGIFLEYLRCYLRFM